MIQTRVTELLGIQHPILQGGMAWVADAKLAGSVSEAGGLGIIAAGNAPADIVRRQIEAIRTITDRPFAVNVMLMSPFVDEIAQLVVELRVPVLTTGAGNPGKYMKQWKEAGIKVIPVVPSVAIAKKMQQSGADAVICEGGEAGGHIGDLTTMALTPQVVDAVDIPVIAAGGIGDGRGMAAALMLGAEGVQIGTRFLVSTSCQVHPTYKERVIAARDTGTIATGRRLGHPVRALKSPFTRNFASKENDTTFTLEDLEKMGTGALRLAVLEGDLENGCFMAGQIAGLVDREQSSQGIIDEIIAGAESCLKGGTRCLK
ncbi:MAG: enoyl-[acyl-carrier-protein] reductase FabK [Bacillota bacterium]|nr:enoyl-[acyl-carrier-protein] reductase FabK [Bacillota bacterium]